MIEHVLQSVNTILFLPDDYIVKQGEENEKHNENVMKSLYFISKGEWEVTVRDEKNFEHSIAIIEQGVMFGEIALISNSSRTATVQCLNYNILEQQDEESFNEMWRLYPEVVSKFKHKRSQYNDKWKKFLKSLIVRTDYFNNLSFMCQEELIYSLKTQSFEEGSIIFDNRSKINKLYYVSEGEISIVLQLDNGEEVITDMLSQGSYFGAYSILKNNEQMFTYKASSFVSLLSIDRDSLDRIREEFSDLNKNLKDYEQYIEEHNVPVWDYCTMQSNVKEKFRLAVNRSMILNEYENKKNSKIGLLIEQLKKQNAENELKEIKRQKRERYKDSLKVNVPNFDESTMYTIEVFKFMNKYIDKMMNRSHNFEIIKEGVKLLQIALNNPNNEELDVIPEDEK